MIFWGQRLHVLLRQKSKIIEKLKTNIFSLKKQAIFAQLDLPSAWCEDSNDMQQEGGGPDHDNPILIEDLLFKFIYSCVWLGSRFTVFA